jgi:putative hydrolase of the HAD superfamily
MNRNALVHAVIFDMGGTLEDVRYDEVLRVQAIHGIESILSQHGLGSRVTISELFGMVKAGMARYNLWREETCIELSPERLWSEYVLTDARFPKERVAEIGEELAFYYDLNFYTRELRPDAKEMLDTLRARGFALGVISNVYSREAVPHNLMRYGLNRYLDVVLSSAQFGFRKPDPRIFLEAARLLNLLPNECAYVGDTVSRDVVGAHRAGYARAIQIKSFLTEIADKETDTEQPDAVVENLMQVIELVTDAPELSR